MGVRPFHKNMISLFPCSYTCICYNQPHMQAAVASLFDSIWLLRWCVRVSQLKNSTTNSEFAFFVSVSIRVFFSSVIPLPVTIIVFSCVVLCDQQANSIAFSVHNLKSKVNSLTVTRFLSNYWPIPLFLAKYAEPAAGLSVCLAHMTVII